MKLLYQSGWTLQQIADQHGISRDRVHKILAAGAPGTTGRRRTHPSRKPRWCPVCHTRLSSQRKITCSRRCTTILDLLRYHLDDRYRDRIRDTNDRWALNHPDRDPAGARHAHRRARGEADRRPRRLVPSSKAAQLATQAVREQWPLAARLHPEIRAHAALLANHPTP